MTIADKPETGIDDFMDKWGSCKICEGEIPYGHQGKCYIYAQEKEIKFLKKELKRVKDLGFEYAVEKNHLQTELETEIGRLKLVAGRYQWMWEAAQLCINKIDDYLEYDMPPHKTFEIIQKEVQKHLKIYTEAVSGLLKKRGM